MKKIVYVLLLGMSLLFTGCATSDAGQDQIVTSGESVTLDGSNSTSMAGKNLLYHWEQLTGPKVDLKDQNSSIANFIAPDVTQTIYLQFVLIVTEEGTYFNSVDHVTVTVEPAQIVSGITVNGTVSDINGLPISGATVTIGKIEIVTNKNGSYTIPHVQEDKRVSINVSHPDYLKNSRIIQVTDKNVIQNITLDNINAILKFLSNEGGTVSEGNGAEVILPAGGYVDSEGNNYNGDIIVKMSYHAITSQSGRETFPGTFEGIENNGTTFPIQSYGFMNVELSDTNGNSINLDGNATATLIFPEDQALYMPSILPLWYYDESLGYWIEEGEAVKQIGNTYSGTVKHFTSWSLAQNTNTIPSELTITGTFINYGPGSSGNTINIYYYDSANTAIYVTSGDINVDNTFNISFQPINDITRYSIGTCRPLNSITIDQNRTIYNVNVEQYDGCSGSEWDL